MREKNCMPSTLLMVSIIALIVSVGALRVHASPDTINPFHDGMVYEWGGGGSGRTDANPVGDHSGEGGLPANAEIRILMKFDITGITGAVQSATLYLHLYASRVDNTTHWAPNYVNPGLGACRVRHIADYDLASFPSVAHFNAPSIGNDPGELIGSDEVPGEWVSIDVTAAMSDDVSDGDSYMALIIYMEAGSDLDNAYDFWEISDMEARDPSLYPYIEYSIGSVGGQILSINTMQMIAPYLLLVVAAAGITYVFHKKRGFQRLLHRFYSQ